MKKLSASLWMTSLAMGLSFFPIAAKACTDILIKSQDKGCVIGRSMEFGQVLDTHIQTFPKGGQFQSLAPNQQKGMQWSNRYAYIGMIVNPAKALVDGFNEKGLSVGALWMPGTQYPEPPQGNPNDVIFFADVTSWLLGNFATVEEAKAGLEKVQIYAADVPGFSAIPPIHLSIQDASGKSVALEFLNGKLSIFNNPIGILTNAPELPWHLTNLRNYLNLRAINAGSVDLDGTVLEPTGQGSGLMGIPGDWTPPSRFVRAAIFKQAIAAPKDAKAAVLALIHLLNTVDIPYGAIRASKDKDFDFTQWIVIKDLGNQNLYYRTYNNPNIQMISLKDNSDSSTIIPLNVSIP